MVVELQLPLLPPSVNALWRIRKSRHTKKAFLSNSEEYDAWLEDMHPIANAQRRGRVIVGPYHLSVQLKRPEDNRKRDLDNFCAKAISDLLVNIGVIANDCHCEMISARWVTSGEGVYVRVEPAGVE